MPHGFNGRVLRVDLSQGKTTVEEPNDNFYRRYIGGRGFISYYLLKELKPHTDPLGPENRLIFATGVVTGAPVGGSARNSVGAKSPLTGAYGDAEVGGYFGAELKRAGYDAIVFQGRSPRPVYLWVQDGEAQLRDATHLWGLFTADTEKKLQEELGDTLVRTAVIGPAGEKQVRFACIMNDIRHTAGRTGLGAVMGSKNLKAVAVRGHKATPYADSKEVTAFGRWLRDNWMLLRKPLHDFGTARGVADKNAQGTLPAYNFREDTFHAAERLTGQAWHDAYLVRRSSCYACPIHCKREVEVKGEYQVSPIYGGPEYETIAGFGSNCGIDRIEPVLKAHEVCQAYGLDTISTAGTIAFAIDCFQQGLITEKDTGGLVLEWGNPGMVLKLIELIGRCEGFGQLLSQGSARAARAIGRGAEKLAVHVKGQEPALQEPRLEVGLGLGFAVSPTGADHNHNLHDIYANSATAPLFHELQEVGILELPPTTELSPAKVRMLIYHINWQHFQCSAVWCRFVPFTHQQLADLTRAITGWNTTVWELMKAGERANNLTRAFNVREGFTRADDSLPPRFFEAVPSGPNKGLRYTPEMLERGKDMYYRMMGWDEEGRPTLGKLEELGIEWVSEAMAD